MDAGSSGLRYGGRGSLADGSHRWRQQPREFSDLSKATHPGVRKTRKTASHHKKFTRTHHKRSIGPHIERTPFK